VSEYGAGANINQHEDDPKQPKTAGQWHPEEWQSIVHEVAWPQLKAKPYVWGTFAWVMFDFTVSTRHEGGVEGRNLAQILTQTKLLPEPDLLRIMDVMPAGSGLYVAPAYADTRRNVVEGSQLLGMAIIAAAKEVPGQRPVSAHMIFSRPARFDLPLTFRVTKIRTGRWPPTTTPCCHPATQPLERDFCKVWLRLMRETQDKVGGFAGCRRRTENESHTLRQ